MNQALCRSRQPEVIDTVPRPPDELRVQTWKTGCTNIEGTNNALVGEGRPFQGSRCPTVAFTIRETVQGKIKAVMPPDRAGKTSNGISYQSSLTAEVDHDRLDIVDNLKRPIDVSLVAGLGFRERDPRTGKPLGVTRYYVIMPDGLGVVGPPTE